MHGDINTIVCNSKDGGAWGSEQRESAFPFQPGSVAEVGWRWGQGARWAGADLGLVARDLGPPCPPPHLLCHPPPNLSGFTHVVGLSGLQEERALGGVALRLPLVGHCSLPFSTPKVCISFDQADLTIKLPDGYTFKFPNRLSLEAINYLSAEGDFKIKCVAFE